jgi:hypothetical protein
MTPCDDVRARLALFVGGDLEPEQAGDVRAHLGLRAASAGAQGFVQEEHGCAGCRQALEQLSRVRGRLLELPGRSPAPVVDLWPSLRGQLAAEGLLQGGVAPVSGHRAAGRLLSWPRLVSAAAAAALVVLGLKLATSEPDPGPGPRPTQVAGEVPSTLDGLAERGGASPLLVPVAGSGGLRRLEPGEEPLHTEALPFVDWMNGWPGLRAQPGLPGVPVDPSRPTFASDRLLR